MATPVAIRFTFKIDGYDGEIRVASFTGHEALSELFSFSIELAVNDDALDFSAIVGAEATLSLHRGDSTRNISGIISRLEQRGSSTWQTSYRVELVPKVWLLTQRHDCRIFQDKSATDIIMDVFSKAGLGEAVKNNARGSFPQRVYCVQYRETDWNFACRLMEEEGIYYFFDTAESGTTLILGNTPQNHLDILDDTKLPYYSPSGMGEHSEWVFDMSFAQRIRSGKVTLRDYNFTTPSLSLERDKSSDKAQGGNPKLEVYDYPGIYEADENGGRLSAIRLQSILAGAKELVGQSTCRRLASGHNFELVDAPRSDFNGKYVVTHIQHDGRQPVGENQIGGELSYDNSFRAIPAAVPFHPLRITPKPVVEGVQTAIVTGPGGEEIYTDKYGRVKVQFPWDREGGKNDKSSCWMRVAQLHAGSGWGAMFIPRIGFEVIVHFIEGDPDRPIITGCVYNAANMPPYGLDAEKTKSTIKSNSSKGGGGFNEYRFEDKKGSEEIYQHGQKDLTIVTNNDKNQKTGHDETLEIGHDRTKTVKNDETTTVNGNRTETVDKNETISIGGNRTETVSKDETITISGNRTESVAKDETISIDGNRTESVTKDETITISGGRTETVSKDESITISGDKSETLEKGLTQSVGADMSVTVTKNLGTSVDKSYSLTVKDKIVISGDNQITLKCGDASITLKKDGKIKVKGSAISLEASGNIKLKGSKIAEN